MTDNTHITNLHELTDCLSDPADRYNFVNSGYHNRVFKASTTYFTSDLHVGHENIIRFCARPYKDVREMNEKIMEAWNNKVPEDADVFILGDVFFKMSKERMREYMNALHGRKHLVLGNHDKTVNLPVDCFEHISQMDNIVVVSDDFQKEDFKEKEIHLRKYCSLVLSHYPLYSWSGILRGTYNLFGHEHNSIDPSEYLLTQMDVGWDTLYEPWSFHEIALSFTDRSITNCGRPVRGF